MQFGIIYDKFKPWKGSGEDEGNESI